MISSRQTDIKISANFSPHPAWDTETVAPNKGQLTQAETRKLYQYFTSRLTNKILCWFLNVLIFSGYFADTSPASRCQVFHVCGQRRGVTNHNAFYSFLCPNGTIFNQLYLICDWWFNVNCESPSSPPSLTRPPSLPSPRSSVTRPEGEGETLIRLDTIYSAIRAANAKYESQHDDNRTISYVDVPSIERSARFSKKINSLRNRKRRKSRKLKLRVFAPWIPCLNDVWKMVTSHRNLVTNCYLNPWFLFWIPWISFYLEIDLVFEKMIIKLKFCVCCNIYFQSIVKIQISTIIKLYQRFIDAARICISIYFNNREPF